MAAGVSDFITMRERLAGRWQITALLGAVTLLGVTGWYYRWPGRFPSVTEQAGHLSELIDAGYTELARSKALSLFGHWAYQDHKLGPIQYQYARAVASDVGLNVEASAQPIAIPAGTLRNIISSYREAMDEGVELHPIDHLVLGRAYRRLDQPITALDHLRKYASTASDIPLEVGRSLVELMIESPIASPLEIHRALRDLETAASDRADTYWWAYSNRLEQLLAAGLLNPALELVFGFKEEPETVESRNELEYRRCRVLFEVGDFEEAEQRLRMLRSELPPTHAIYSRAGWLLGTCIISGRDGQRPEQAASLFEEVIMRHPGDELGGGAQLGLALAQYYLREYGRSIESLENAVSIAGEMNRDSWILNHHQVGSAAYMMSVGTAKLNAGSTSLAYLRTIHPIIEVGTAPQHVQYLLTLGSLEGSIANQLQAQLDDSPPIDIGDATNQLETIRNHYVRAGESMWRASEFSVLQEHLAESAHWNAIDYFEKAGKRGQAINLLTQFVSGRSTSNRMPEALNRLGSLLQSVGRFEPAITVYQTCIRDFPRTVEGNRALLLLAQSYLRSGPQYQQESEDTLRLIVDNSELFGPSSPEYIEALGGLGELYSMNGEYEKAIPVLEEALLRVGHRGNLLKIRFNLADALRRVGLQIRDQRASAQYVEDQERLKGQEFEALARAGDIYRRIFSQFTANDNNDTGLPQVLHQQSRQYYADCMFFMGRFEEALAYYQEIAWLHRDEVTALSAYVQIINCYLSLESIHEARTAVRRAIQLTESLPREAFVNAPPKGGQVQWRQFFSWIENSSLFDA